MVGLVVGIPVIASTIPSQELLSSSGKDWSPLDPTEVAKIKGNTDPVKIFFKHKVQDGYLPASMVEDYKRAVHDGDMEAGAASQDRYRLGSKEICLGKSIDTVESLPIALQDLLERSDSLYRRIARLDDVLFGDATPVSGACAQLDALAQAFGAG